MTERKPVFGEEWTYGNVTWKCIDDGPDVSGFFGWVDSNGAKFYADHRRATPPKPARPKQAEGWVTVWDGDGFTLGTLRHQSALDAFDCWRSAGWMGALGNMIGALNLETGEWVPRP